MADANATRKKLEASEYKIAAVFCPTYWKQAQITAAKWARGEGHVQVWDVVECPLLPAGEVWCDKRCLDQIDEIERPK